MFPVICVFLLNSVSTLTPLAKKFTVVTRLTYLQMNMMDPPEPMFFLEFIFSLSP